VAIRRLPFLYLRLSIAALAVMLCAGFSLTNHLMYRTAPWQVTAEITRDIQKTLPSTQAPRDPVMVLLPRTRYPGDAPIYTFFSVFGVRPPVGSEWPSWHLMNVTLRVPDDHEYLRSLERMRNNRRVPAIVVTDRQGDLNTGDLTTESVQSKLGPNWMLVSETLYPMHYEWRFYIFNCWRTRVWVRQPPATVPATTVPASSQPASAPASSPVSTTSVER